jgi:uncharacterized protein YndB with AHSA1/START domain
MLGTLHSTGDGRFALRFERRLAHPPAKVWRAITDPEQLRGWFPAVVDFDLTVGAKLRFGPTPEQVRRFGWPEEQIAEGEITRVEPPEFLEYTWGDEVLRWELAADGKSGCLLVFTNIFDDRATAATAAAGWHAGLEVVAAQLDGRAVDWSPWDRAEELGGYYARALG